MKRLYYLIIILCVGLTVGCKKELDFTYRDIPAIPVIEAELTCYGAKVVVTQTTPMDEPMNRDHMTEDVVVKLTDNDSGESFTLEPDSVGIFVSAYEGVIGHIYRLDVTIGQKCFTCEERMRAPVDSVSLAMSWIQMPYDDVAVLQVEFPDIDPETDGSCYWIRVKRNGDAYMWRAVKDIMATEGIVTDVMMTSRRDISEEDDATVLVDGDELEVSVTTISRVMYDYLVAIGSDSNGHMMFDGDFCLGYFLTGGVTEASIVFHPEELTGGR